MRLVRTTRFEDDFCTSNRRDAVSALWWCDCPCWCEYTSPGHEMPIPADAEVTHTKVRNDECCPACGATRSAENLLEIGASVPATTEEPQ